MARIPMGDFGNVRLQPGPVVRADPEAYGAGVAQTVQQAGQAGMREAGQDIAQANWEIDRARKQKEAEERQAQREAEQEAKAAAREADRVRSVTAQATVSNNLNALHDEISAGLADGTVDKAGAMEMFNKRAEQIRTTGLESVSAEHKPLVDAMLLDNFGRAQRSVAGLVTARDKADIKAGGLQFIEEMQRFASRGGKEADEAIAKVRTFWTATGPRAGEDPAQAQARVQQFAERVRFTQATALVNADPGAAMKALKDPNYLPELDPGARTNLIHTADARVTQAANRAEIAAQARERKMARDWGTLKDVFERGKMPDAVSLENARKMFKGTSYEAALTALTAQAPAATAFASQPVTAQRQALMDMQARMNSSTASPDQVKAYDHAQQLHTKTLADIEKDPYQAAAERGVIVGVQPLSLDIQALPAQLRARGRDAQQVGAWVGQDVSLFRPAEAEKLGDMISAMPPKDRTPFMEAIGKTMTPAQMRAFGKQLGAKDDTLAAAVLLSAQGAKTDSGRLTSEILFAGIDAVKDQRIKWPKPQTEIRADIDRETRGAFGSEASQRAAGDAAMAVYAGLISEGKTPDVAQAVRLATGGIMDMDGQRFVKPYGWTDARVRKALRDVTPARVAELAGGQLLMGGVPVTAEDVSSMLSTEAQLIPTRRPGSYAVTLGLRPLTDERGRPFILPLAGGD